VFQALADGGTTMAAHLLGQDLGMLAGNFRTPWIINDERVPF
jgi:hypothetical protein